MVWGQGSGVQVCAPTLWSTPNVHARCSTYTVRPPSAKLAVCCCSTYYGNKISMHAPIPNWQLPRFNACVKAHGHGSYTYVRMHTCFVKWNGQTWNQKVLQQTVAHTAGNTHEMHKHIFVFGVDSLHLTAQYRLQLVDSPCQRPADHSATSTKTLMVAVRV